MITAKNIIISNKFVLEYINKQKFEQLKDEIIEDWMIDIINYAQAGFILVKVKNNFINEEITINNFQLLEFLYNKINELEK